MSSGQYGGRPETLDERRQRLRTMLKTLSWVDLVLRPTPWVLVPNGSILGYFDWVPISLRVGPWSIVAIPYLAGLVYLFTLATIWIADDNNSSITSTTTITGTINDVGSGGNSDAPFNNNGWPNLQEAYFKYTAAWYYNLIGFFWMTFVFYKVISGPGGYFPLATYTMQSWILVWWRHGLSAAMPFLVGGPYEKAALFLTETLRFPALATALITFVMWNFVVGPAIFILLREPDTRRGFMKFFINFRMTQLHVFNILFATLNGIYTSPKRPLFVWDLYVAVVLAMAYLLLYLLVMDRLGIHIYPIFSPRTAWLLVTWTLAIGNYLAAFWLWGRFLQPLQQKS